MSELSEADIVFNRASLALAKSQRLITSWLPPGKQQEDATDKTELELEKEESEVFAPVPELLGLGALSSGDVEGRPRRGGPQSFSPDERLRKQLLGKQVLRSSLNDNRAPDRKLVQLVPTKPRPQDILHSDSEDEKGRTAFTGKMRKATRDTRDPEKLRGAPEKAATGDDPSIVDRQTPDSAKPKKRSGSYLDEVLLARSEKRKKKNIIKHPKD